MDNDLNRSLRLLEDAVAVKGRSLLRAESTPKSKQKKIDLSLTLAPHEINQLLEAENADSYYDKTFSTILDRNKSLTGSIIRANEPWKHTVDSLYAEFFEILQSHSVGHEIFDVVADLARCCSDAIKVITGLKSKVAVDKIDDESFLEIERNIWRLIFVLYQDRLNTLNQEDEQIISKPFTKDSEKECVLNLFKTDSLVRESQLVIDWLEWSAAEREAATVHFSDTAIGWENTVHQLLSEDTIVFASSRKIVTSIDPDAMYYQNLPLHDLDMEDETRLCRHVFREIRCGKLDEAQKLCCHSGHAWRAALYEGWRLYHDPNMTSIDENMEQEISAYQNGDGAIMVEERRVTQPTEGNENRDIWKKMAYTYCQQDYLNVYEKAAMATLCGNLETLLSVCNNWEDYLWAYMKVIVDVRVESEIRDMIIKDYEPLPPDYWANKMSLNDIFNKLEASKNSLVRAESSKPDYIVQKYIILDDINKLLEAVEEWIDQPLVATQFLRFLSHLLLFFEQIGRIQKRDTLENVLEMYIQRLCEMNETQLVAFYVSKMGPQNQIHLYASYLERILDNEMRKEALGFAEDCGLNTHEITKRVVTNMRNRPHEIRGYGDLQPKLSEPDKLKISALDWLLIYDSQRLEALIQSNMLISTFITLGKLDAAQLAHNKIPADSVDQILSEGELTLEINQVIREHLGFKLYLDAHDAFNVWFKQLKSRPLPPEDLHENAQFTEKVAHQHRMSQCKADTERWKMSMINLTKKTKTMLYNVLLFPEGGWLSGAKDGDHLRSICIPEIVLLLYSVLSESGQHEECVQIADLLAAEKLGLYTVYSREKLGEILGRLSESSFALLNEKKDPWGLEKTA